MKRHKIWYKRELFKNHFRSYKHWDRYNPPSGDKHPDRYKNEAVQCQNSQCQREGILISEHEAYYCFASQSKFKRFKKKIIYIFQKERKKDKESIYICPFCGKDDVKEI